MTEVKKQRALKCVVVSDKMDKTRVGLVQRLVKHPVVGKYIKRSTKIHFHDEKNQTKTGDAVSIVACRPMSKKKSFTLVNQ